MVEKTFDDSKSEGGTPFKKKNPTTHFSSNVLKTIIGPDRALTAFQSMSTGNLEAIQEKKKLVTDELTKATSQGFIGKSFLGEKLNFDAIGNNKRIQKLKARVEKKANAENNLDKYFDDSDSCSDESDDLDLADA